MVTAVLVWIGVVLGLALLLTMALGPAIVQIDSKLYERKRRRDAGVRVGR
ncbi:MULTISPECIES: hypothetical protein [Actinokineospora]|uniref:Uncharacterized protein n=1 Tax=Actinokineospora fastidiosa TaxID=1816 RepID=A0A918G4S6_9PSEU|nr:MULTISPECIES: hypothetical protein [Actinokineospora]UVS76446.1 hypothetical protein Actkin_00133 [Actinokineospora sp. UTMC 2448]GGS18109.1 hypothetical protein GCM10010171_08290 [Actinokineospora fastidiosa]